jgi:hypothetical protein
MLIIVNVYERWESDTLLEEFRGARPKRRP